MLLLELKNLKRFTWRPMPKFDQAKEAHTEFTHLYETPRGDILKSVTTFLSKVKGLNPGIERWKQNVGVSVANHISKESKSEGTATHKIIEQYLNNEIPSDLALLVRGHFLQLKDYLDKIDDIYATEQILYDYEMSLAGTADLIGKYDGIESLVDFKTSKQFKKEEWIEDYFLQASIYSIMWNRLTGKQIKQIVILISSKDGTTQEFIKNPRDYYSLIDSKLKKFREMGGFES
jgi:genome maintenance exonuclease 1